MARFLMFPKVPRQVGQQDNLGRQLAHTKWPTWHCMIGGKTTSKQTGHSNKAANSSVRVPGAVFRVDSWLVELEEAVEFSPLLLPRPRFWLTSAILSAAMILWDEQLLGNDKYYRENYTYKTLKCYFFTLTWEAEVSQMKRQHMPYESFTYFSKNSSWKILIVITQWIKYVQISQMLYLTRYRL